MLTIEAFCRGRTRFSRFFDCNSGHTDRSRPPVTFPDTEMPPMFLQRAPTPVADYITKNGNVMGGFPIERVARPIVDLVMNSRDMDATLLPACEIYWPKERPSPPGVQAALRDAQRYMFGGIWVARDFLLQILRDFDVAGELERLRLVEMCKEHHMMERIAMERLSC